jgi:hypothetical protein
MALTAKSRAQVALNATTTLEPAAVLAVVKQATSGVKGGGLSLLTSGIANVGAQVHVEREEPERLALSITSGKRIVELCTFSAQVSANGGRTRLRVGGLESYKTSQSAFPPGPKSIMGYDLYRRFLDAVAAGLRASDGSAEVTIAGPAGH